MNELKHSDRVVSIAFMVIALIFFLNTMKLPENSQMYPRFMIGIMTFLAILIFIKSFFKAPEKEWKELFGHIQWKRFLFVFVISFVYIALINTLGFFTTTLLYLIISMVFLKGTVKTFIISIPSFMLVLYLVFRIFLKVPLPTGILI